MIVLGICDGCSCGQLALRNLGIKNDYYASEVDKYAMLVANHNFPRTKQLGDFRNWREWDIPKPDLIMGGTPCQGFSFMGKRLHFNDTRSSLILDFFELLDFYKPKYFLLENVRMAKKCEDYISERLADIYPSNNLLDKGLLKPMLLNSRMVSAQNRPRLYWFNWDVDYPQDKGLVIKDILSDELPATRGKYTLKEDITYNQIGYGVVGVVHQLGFDLKKRVYSQNGKSPTLMTHGSSDAKYALDDTTWSTFTPLECERLQTMPDYYTSGVSDSQRKKMIGNGWTIKMIEHILRGMK